MERERAFNILRGIVITSHLESEIKAELLEFIKSEEDGKGIQ